MITPFIQVYGRIKPEHIDEVVAIDKYWFNQEPSQTQFEWVVNFPWLYSVLTNKRVVEGYSLVIPVDPFAHRALKMGEMGEDELTKRHIRSLDECSGLYLASVATRPEAKRSVRKQIVGIAQGQILRPKVEMFAIAISPAGDKIARELQMAEAEYTGPFSGLGDYRPKLFVQNPFV